MTTDELQRLIAGAESRDTREALHCLSVLGASAVQIAKDLVEARARQCKCGANA